MSSPISKYDFGLWRGDAPSPFASNILMQQLAEEKRRREDEKAQREQERLGRISAHPIATSIMDYLPLGRGDFRDQFEKGVTGEIEGQVDPLIHGAETVLGAPKQALDIGVGMATDPFPGGWVDPSKGNEAGQLLGNVAQNALAGKMMPQPGFLGQQGGSVGRGGQQLVENIGALAADPNTYLLPGNRAASALFAPAMGHQIAEGALTRDEAGKITPEGWANIFTGSAGLGLATAHAAGGKGGLLAHGEEAVRDLGSTLKSEFTSPLKAPDPSNVGSFPEGTGFFDKLTGQGLREPMAGEAGSLSVGKKQSVEDQ